LYLGANTKASADGTDNEIVIGYNAIGAGSHSVVLGNDSITKTILKGNVGIGQTAPAYKLDVAGTGNFTGTVNVATPTAGTNATTKDYVDSAVSHTVIEVPTTGRRGSVTCADYGAICLQVVTPANQYGYGCDGNPGYYPANPKARCLQ